MLLLLLKNICLLLLPGLLLHRLLLLPGHLLLFGVNPFLLLLLPARAVLAGENIPDLQRRQVHRHQQAEQRSQENKDNSQHRSQEFPQRPAKDHPERTAAEVVPAVRQFADTVVVHVADHAQPVSVVLFVQGLHRVPADQHDKRAQPDKAQQGKNPRPDRRAPLGGPDHQSACPQG